MLGLKDLYLIASDMNDTMLKLNQIHKNDYRDGLCLYLEVPNLDFINVDEELYKNKNKSNVGYERGDEVNVNIMGINFKLVVKEEEEA